jgi:hypothetical protein
VGPRPPRDRPRRGLLDPPAGYAGVLRSHRGPQMLDFEAAKRVARERWLSAFDDEPGGPQVIHEAECVEYEWGWLIRYGPSRPDQVPPEEARWGILPVLVDRVTGHVMHVSTSGVKLAILALLESRPPESRSPDLFEEESGGLSRVRVSMRAFTPLREWPPDGPEASETVEVIRLSRDDG